MQTVFDNAMCAHVWAQQKQPHGRSSNGNLYFEGRKLFSYGTHYTVGYALADGHFLVNTESRSVTTARHRSHVWRAVGYGRVAVGVPSLGSFVALCVDDSTGRLRRAETKRFIEKTAQRWEPDSAIRVLGWAGWNDAMNMWAGIARRLALRLKRESEKENREKQARNVERGVAFLRKNPAQKQYALAGNAADLRCLSLELHRAHRAMCATRRTRMARDLWPWVAKARELVKARESAENRGFEHSNNRRLVRSVRSTDWSALDRESLSCATYSSVAKALGAVVNLKRIGGRDPVGLRDLLSKCTIAANMARIRETAEREAKQAAGRDEWLAGENNHWRGTMDGGALLRAVGVVRDESGAIVAGELQTSQGARVPLVHAIKALAVVRRVVATGSTWQRNGHEIRVGHFNVDRIDFDGTMTAGCHVIRLAEMERIARGLDL